MKIGFNAPLPHWFGGAMQGWLLEQTESPDFLQHKG